MNIPFQVVLRALARLALMLMRPFRRRTPVSAPSEVSRVTVTVRRDAIVTTTELVGPRYGKSED